MMIGLYQLTTISQQTTNNLPLIMGSKLTRNQNPRSQVQVQERQSPSRSFGVSGELKTNSIMLQSSAKLEKIKNKDLKAEAQLQFHKKAKTMISCGPFSVSMKSLDYNTKWGGSQNSVSSVPYSQFTNQVSMESNVTTCVRWNSRSSLPTELSRMCPW